MEQKFEPEVAREEEEEYGDGEDVNVNVNESFFEPVHYLVSYISITAPIEVDKFRFFMSTMFTNVSRYCCSLWNAMDNSSILFLSPLLLYESSESQSNGRKGRRGR
jgi:hypothetical protein